MRQIYSFRIRFNRSPTDTIECANNEIEVPVQTEGVSILLRNTKADQPIKDAEHLALHGVGYASEEEAAQAGSRLQSALMVALARVRVGADFGDRAAKGAFTAEGLKWLEQQHGQRMLNNVHGLMVYASDPKPHFALTHAKVTRGASTDSFRAALNAAIANQPTFTERERLAFALFNASFFQPTADSRFLLLLVSIESLIEPAPRSPEARQFVQQLITQAKVAQIARAERDSTLQLHKFYCVVAENGVG